MALAKKCDTCGRFFEFDRYSNKHNGFMYVRFNNIGTLYDDNVPYDCCPECMEKIQNFIKGLKKGETEKDV